MTDCIFCKVAKREVEKEFTYEDEEIMVFPDMAPAAPFHLLIVPKAHIEDFMSPEVSNGRIWEKMTNIARSLIEKNNLKGYRLVANGGTAKLVNHLHLHIIGDVSAERKL